MAAAQTTTNDLVKEVSELPFELIADVKNGQRKAVVDFQKLEKLKTMAEAILLYEARKEEPRLPHSSIS